MLETLGIAEEGSGVYAADFLPGEGAVLASECPADGQILARVRGASRAEYDAVVASARGRFTEWRMRPAPKRAELVRRLGELLRRHKEPLGELISLEVGKIRAEGLGEVQEMIDICDYAVGLSRQLYGLTIASERPRHRMM
ncbi:MAG: aldehyde dehydrogenase family protein, partial [Myxococcales bacterium]